MATILVVDDRAANRQFLVTLLGHSGHRLLEAEDGAQALAIARAEHPDLIITDILIPVIGGYEFARQLRDDRDFDHAPIIFYTATYQAHEARSLAKAAGVQYVLTKPAEPQAILDLVNTALGKLPGAAPSSEIITKNLIDPLKVVSAKLTSKMGELGGLNLRLSELIELGIEIGAERDPRRLLEKFCESARKILHARYAAVGILARDGRTLEHFITSGMDPETVAQMDVHPTGKGILGILLNEPKAVRLRDLTADPRSAGFPPGHPVMRSFLGVRIGTSMQIYGNLYLTEKLDAEEFSEDDERLAHTLASQVAVAYENAYLYYDIQRHAAKMQLEILERQKAEEKFRLALEGAPNAIVLVNSSGEIVLVNSQTEKYFGYHRTELIGQNIDRLVPVRFRGNHAGLRAGFLRETEARPMGMGRDLFGLRKDGSEFPVEIGLSPIETGSGMMVMATVVDITQRKQAEEALRESEDHYRSLFSQILHGFALHEIICDESGQPVDYRFLEINPAFEALTGLRASEVVGRTVLEVMPGTEQYWIEAYGQVALTGESLQFQNYSQELGKYYEVLAYCPKPGHFAVLFSDVTERKKAEEALRESEERFRRAIEDAPYPVQIHAEDGEIISVNTMWLSLTGYTREEIPTIDAWTERAYGERKAVVQAAISKLFALESVFDEGEDVVRTAGGEFRTWHFSSAPLGRLPDGRRIVISMANDVTDRKQAETKIQQQLQRLAALREIDRAISSTTDLRLSLRILLAHTLSLLRVDAADILLVNPVLNVLEYAAGIGFMTPAIENAQVRLGEEFAGRAALRHEAVHMRDIRRAQLQPSFTLMIKEEGFIDYQAVPLIAKGKVLGVLEAYQRNAVERDSEWLDFLETLAGQAAIAIENAQAFEGIQRSNIELMMAYDATIVGWSHAMDLRDKETEGHTQRVTELTMQLAERMGMGEADLLHVRRGALLHDMGKLGVPDSILHKPGKLTDDEWEIMRRHPTYARDMLAPIVYLRPAIDIPYCHHEKWDGTGYPRGLQGENIPLSARIFAVVDVWDALTSDRPYRAAWTREKALQYIREESGTHFDPEVVEVFLRLIGDMTA